MKTRGCTHDNELLDSIIGFLDQQSSTLRNGHFCSYCGGVLTYFDVTFWLYGEDRTWTARLPTCPFCETSAQLFKEEIDMDTAVTRAPLSAGWREMYKAALFEVDIDRQLQLIAEAELVLTFRAWERFQSKDDHIEEETALEDALYALHALRSAATNRKKTPEFAVRNEWAA
jgi:hypothetical protein